MPVTPAFSPQKQFNSPQPLSQPQSQGKPQHPSEYTFGRNYTADWIQGVMPSPGVKERGELPPSLPPTHTNKLLPNNNKTRISTLHHQQQRHNYHTRRPRTRRLVGVNSSSSQIAASQPRLQTRAEWHKDPRRKESLASKFNTGDSFMTLSNPSSHKPYHTPSRTFCPSLTHFPSLIPFVSSFPLSLFFSRGQQRHVGSVCAVPAAAAGGGRRRMAADAGPLGATALSPDDLREQRRAKQRNGGEYRTDWDKE